MGDKKQKQQQKKQQQQNNLQNDQAHGAGPQQMSAGKHSATPQMGSGQQQQNKHDLKQQNQEKLQWNK